MELYIYIFTREVRTFIYTVQVVQDVPSLIVRLKKNKDSVDFLVRFAELIYTFMYLHPGFPDLYDPVLTALEVIHFYFLTHKLFLHNMQICN